MQQGMQRGMQLASHCRGIFLADKYSARLSPKLFPLGTNPTEDVLGHSFS
jgi:hypothetical protein